MNASSPFRLRTWWSSSAALLLGLAAVAVARLLWLPKSLWEWDEVLFVRGIADFDPLHHSPHPPGYPLLIGLGKAMAWIVGDPFHGLVALSVISSCIGFVALAKAFHSFAGGGLGGEETGRTAGVVGALLFHLSPAMLVYGPLALSDPPALMFLSLALAAVGRMLEKPSAGPALALGAFASAAIGCRPQLCLAVLPMLALAMVPLWRQPQRWKIAGSILLAFTAVSLAWFLPLVAAVGGPGELLPFLNKQAGLVASYDSPRTGLSWKQLATRFLAHPWGPRVTSLPVLVLAALGITTIASRQFRARLPWVAPIVVLTAVELLFALAVMNPRDAVRYALPSMLGVAFAAGVGAVTLSRRLGFSLVAYGVAVAFSAASLVYTLPLLVDRSHVPSTPVQAIDWALANLPRDTVFLVDKELAAHAAQLLPRSRSTFDIGFAGDPDLPVWLIADGETALPGALAFRWLESDPYGKLTRNFYRVTSLTPIPPERRYRAERGVFGYEPTAREAAWRWLAPEAAIRIVPAGARELVLSLAVPTVAPLASNRVAITVAGVPAAELEIPRGERRTATLPLPAPKGQGQGEEIEVVVRSADSFVPFGTPRRLAVQLVGFELKGRAKD